MRLAGILFTLFALLPIAAVASQTSSTSVSVVKMRATIILKRDVWGDYSLSPKYFGELAHYASAHYRVVGPFFGIYPVDPDTVGGARQLHWSVAQQLGAARVSGASDDGYPSLDAATRDVFSGLELHQVDPVACLKSLGARVSPSPHELIPVKPVININMVDPRFIGSQDVLGGLDQRPNLAELTPGEFESLITNLFEKMGLETKQTRASRDGGVDCVAWDKREILGERL